AVRHTGPCGRRRPPLAAPLGDRCSRALGDPGGLERKGVMDRVDLSALFLHFLALWFVAVGGPSAILPEIHRYVVEAHHLMTRAVNHDWRVYLITLVTVALVLRTSWNPLWLLAVGALAGMVGLV